MLLKNQICLITGASKGIGKSICLTFAEHGARVILTGRNLESLETVSKDLPNQHLNHLCLEMDVQNMEHIEEVFSRLNREKVFIKYILF